MRTNCRKSSRLCIALLEHTTHGRKVMHMAHMLQAHGSALRKCYLAPRLGMASFH